MAIEDGITWFSYGREGSPDKLEGDGSVEDIVSHHPDVQARLEREAGLIFDAATVSLIKHRVTGGAQLGAHKADLDWYVYLHDVYDDGALAAHNAERLAKWHKRNNKRLAEGKGPLEDFQPSKSLRGGAANSIENGHFAKNGDWVEGLHVIQNAVEARIKAGRKELK